MFTQILIGFVAVVVGFFITAKADWIVANFGTIAWFESHWSTSGGSRFFYKLIGIVCILGGFMVATGMLQAMVRSIFSPFFGSITGA